MEFERVIRVLLSELAQCRIRYGARLDWIRLREYYQLFDREEELARLRERYAHAQ